MKDRYLYRAKRKDNGEWIIGSLIQTPYLYGVKSWISSEEEDKTRLRAISTYQADWRAFEVRTDTICQCTGLKDKNGKLIWENDVVTGWFDDKRITGYIKYGSNGIFYIERNGLYGIHLDNSQDWLEGIGNIFDNPELLEVEE